MWIVTVVFAIIIIGCDLLFYSTHIFSSVLEAVYRREHCCLCPKTNTAVSTLRCHLDGYHSQQMPWPCCHLLGEADGTGWQGPAHIPGGAGEGCGGFSKAASQLSSITTTDVGSRLIRSATQSPWQPKPLSGNSWDRKSPALPIPMVRSMKVTLPILGKSIPKHRLHMANLHGDESSGSQPG